jgi:hypothetical protein
MPLVPWSTKIGVSQNHRNKTDFRNLLVLRHLFWADGQRITRDAS